MLGVLPESDGAHARPVNDLTEIGYSDA